MFRFPGLLVLLLVAPVVGPGTIHAQIGSCHYCDYWWFDNPPGLCEVCFHYAFVGYQDCQQYSCWDCNDNVMACPIWAGHEELTDLVEQVRHAGLSILIDDVDPVAHDLRAASDLLSMEGLDAPLSCEQRLRAEKVLRRTVSLAGSLYVQAWSL